MDRRVIELLERTERAAHHVRSALGEIGSLAVRYTGPALRWEHLDVLRGLARAARAPTAPRLCPWLGPEPLIVARPGCAMVELRRNDFLRSIRRELQRKQLDNWLNDLVAATFELSLVGFPRRRALAKPIVSMESEPLGNDVRYAIELSLELFALLESGTLAPEVARALHDVTTGRTLTPDGPPLAP